MSSPQKATIVSSSVAFSLAILKFIVGIFSGSIAVISSAIDSLMDLFVSLFNVFAIHLSEERPNKLFNYGKGKIEAMASFFEGIIIIISGIYILLESAKKIASKEGIVDILPSVAVMLVSVITTFFLVMYLNRVAKKTENIVVMSDILHYKTDLFSNAGVLLSLIVIYFTDFHIIDSIIGIIIALFFIKEAFKLVKKGFLLLMDVSLSESDVSKIKNIISNQEKVKKFYNLKTRQSGNTKFIEVNIVVSECMPLLEADKISHIIEAEIKKIDEKFEWDVVIHMDPYTTELDKNINDEKTTNK